MSHNLKKYNFFIFYNIVFNDSDITKKKNFDYPYLYQHLLYHLKDEEKVNNTLSNFGIVELKDGRDRAGNTVRWVQIIDYPIVDMMYCYKARDDGGLNLGTKLNSYSLQNIAKIELGLSKVEYKSEGLTLDQFYEEDPLNFGLYNLWDTSLIVKLDRKMGMIDLYNMQRRKMKTTLSSALRGASPLFDTYVYSVLENNNRYVRWGINNETNFNISAKEIKLIPQVLSKSKIKWSVDEMDARLCGKLISRFPGAYVKEPVPGIKIGLMCDLDANRLYPAMINQYNIGIETFFGRIIQPTMNSTFNFFDKCFGKLSADKLPEAFFHRFLEESENFIENFKSDEYDDEEELRDNKFKNKNEAKQYYYYAMIYLLKKILASGFTLNDLIAPDTVEKYIITKTYFNNLLELMEMCNPKEKEYNYIAYDYIINQNEISNKIKIIENYNEPTYRIVEIDGKYIPEYLKDNRIGMTISGALFKTHEHELSLFYKFLNELYLLRNKYKKEMFTYPEKSKEYTEYYRRQITTKVIMNSTYGLLGMKAFRYSNKWLAKTITTSGRLALKTAQYYTDKYLDAQFV